MDNLILPDWDEETAYLLLLNLLHPLGLHCPNGHPLLLIQRPHKRDKRGIVSYRCRYCPAVFNIYTQTIWEGSHYSCRIILRFLYGLALDFAIQPLAELLQCDYGTLLNHSRHPAIEILLVRLRFIEQGPDS